MTIVYQLSSIEEITIFNRIGHIDFDVKDFTVEQLEKYNVKYCLYGHLHGKSHMNVFDGNYNNVAYKMVSCDYTGFKLIKII